MGEQWLKQSLASGVSMLLLLRLKNAPPEDAIQPTLEAWFRVITYKKTWDKELDRARFESAFMYLAQNCDKFPSPKQLLEAMPKREFKELPPPEITPEQQQKFAEGWRKLKEQLRGTYQCINQENS
ncbi:hypothetical protein [Otariodibacter oris]|uniref:Uncharacterized protein n=1 Tax=Otariodibacter oris TaxID=1032623 RepID=A0A420XIF4_9PAST|nr:hypothetical protein [Otariodibacter oris]QGM80684.1 hypothetical protein A6A10_04330 [Otariodibacter oris]RKR77154.1 hypothetical protein DES31_0479 [Otariodibacter oris]